MLTYNRTGADAAEKTMTYQGNRLTGVSSSGSGASGSVSYDAIGRGVSSDIEGMTEVQYNVTGFPSYIGQADGGYVHNTYAGGVRLSSRRTAADGEVTVMNYEGNEVWENGKLRMLLFDGGYVDFSGNLPKYCWYTKDHLGNVRAVADAQGYMVALYDYRPYGEELTALPADEYQDPVFPGRPVHGRDDDVDEPTPGTSPFVPTVNYSEAAPKGWQPFRFGGKESLTRVGLDLYDFGARMYSPSNARWLTMDPLCEKYYDISPYVYCAGDPVNYFDPDGRDVYGLRNDGGIVLLLVDDTRHELVYMDDTSKSYSMSSDDAFESLKGTEGLSSYTTSFDNFPNIMGLFFFIADHSSSEYAVHASRDKVVIGTAHHEGDAASWKLFGFKERPYFSIHSHPGINAALRDEYWSMGMAPVDDKFKSFNPIEPSDWYWMQNHPEIQAENFVVYFPASNRFFILGYPQKCKRCVNLFSEYRKE